MIRIGRDISWFEIIHTVLSLVIAAALIAACILLGRSNTQLAAVQAALEVRNEQGAEAVTLLRQAVAGGDR